MLNTNYKIKFILTDSCALHLCSRSWLKYSELYYSRRGKYYKRLTKILKNNFVNNTNLDFKY